MRHFSLSASAIALFLLLASLAIAAAPPPANVVTPVFDATQFGNSTRIDNSYFPLQPGTTFVYEGPGGKGEHVEVEVTRDKKTILGVSCVVVRDRVLVKGVLIEDTVDWYAQDRTGNVWYMGEFTTEYKNGEPVSNEGSWEAGMNGAKPGYIMEAHPQVGDAYRQEFLEGEAEDMAEVQSLSESLSLTTGTWTGTVLRTREWTPLEPTVVEYKYYAPGVGLVKTETVRGGSGEEVLVEIRTR